jgi:4-amino-4-deoxy-L-arabinose transferase-like glycosyltransferase
MRSAFNLRAFLGLATAGVFRLLGVVAFVLIWIFPAYKGVWLGYLPVVAGGGLAVLFVWLERRRPGLFQRIERWPESAFRTLALTPCLIQVILILVFRSQPRLDALFVVEEARQLAETGVMNPLTYYAPAQTWWYAFFFRIFGSTPPVAQLSLVLLNALLILAVHGLAGKSAAPHRARWATLLVAFYPTSILYVLVTPYYFYLYTLLMVATALGWLLFVHEDGVKLYAALGGLAAGLAALTKAVFLVAPAQAMAFLFMAKCRAGRSWVAGWLIFVLCFGLVLLPWIIRNYRVFGEPVPVCTSGGLVLYSANNPFSNGLYSHIPDTVKVTSPAQMLAHSRRCSKLAWQFIREHPDRFGWLVRMKWLHTWGNESTYTELINVRGQPAPGLENLLSGVVQTGWTWLVTLWMLRGVGRLYRQQAPSALELIVAILVISEWAVYSLYEGGARHHLPLVPLLIVFVLSAAPADQGRVSAPRRPVGGALHASTSEGRDA